MEYKSLFKLFFSDPNEYKAEYIKRFTDRNAVYLDFSIKENPAFYVPDSELFSYVIDIYKTDKRIMALSSELPKIAISHFTIRCLIDEIILSNGIEGVNSSRREINSALDELKTKSRGKRFYGFVQKYLMLNSNESLSFDTCEDIRNLYDELVYFEIKSDNPNNLPDGKIFRKDATSVVSATQKEIHRGIYPEDKIIDNMNKALKFLNDKTIEPIFRIAIFHYLFGYIHPFYDGNGRTSRFISSYLLSKEFEPIIAFRLSYTIRENIKEYYEAFKICNDNRNKGDLTPFLFMFIKIINESFHQLEDALSKRLSMLEHYHDCIQHLPFSNDQRFFHLYSLLIQASLFSENGISTQELMDMLSVRRTTIANRLKALSDDNLIIKNAEGNARYYKLNLETVDRILENNS